MKIGRVLKKILRLPQLIKCYLSMDRNALLALIEDEAKELLRQYGALGTCNIEGREDLLFHIQSYNEIPEIVRQTEFPMVKDLKMFCYMMLKEKFLI